jgi:hypothetical protein
MEIQKVIDQYHVALDQFSRGDPQPVKLLYSHKEDVSLINPFGQVEVGWNKVSAALDFASSHFKDGEVTNFEILASYKTSELVTIFEIEKWKAKVSGRSEVSPFDLRVTSTFRLEESNWKLVHRHADPISGFNADGPLRKDL